MCVNERVYILCIVSGSRTQIQQRNVSGSSKLARKFSYTQHTLFSCKVTKNDGIAKKFANLLVFLTRDSPIEVCFRVVRF